MRQLLLAIIALFAILHISAADVLSTKIVTYSIHHGLDAAGNENLDGQAAVIAKYAPDFVALQAVDNGVVRSGRVNQAQKIAEKNAMVATFARAITLDGGEYGVALLSKVAPISVQRIPLDYSGEDRVILICEFADCFVATTHLSSTAAEQQTAVTALTNAAANATKPFLIAGLLNCDPGSTVLTEIQRHFTLLNDQFVPNKPATNPTKCASYVGLLNTNGFKATTLAQQVGAEPAASDYRPLYVEVRVERNETNPIPTAIPEPTGDVRLMSYNIRHGSDINKEMNLDGQIEVMRKWKADYIMVQEVDSVCLRSGKVNEAQLMADALGMHATFARAIDFEGGKYGVALLSREKPISVARYPLSNNSEPRVLLVCEFADKFVACTHLSFERNEHEAPVTIINAAAQKATKPFFIGGDWNDEPQSVLLNSLRQTFTILSDDYVLSYPADVPTMCIDYIAAYKNDAVKQPVVTLQHLANEPTASDHRPLIVDFRWSDALEQDACATPRISLLRGKIAIECDTPDAEIHYSVKAAENLDGIGRLVDLPLTYTITAYATKAGLPTSANAVKEITLDDILALKGDVDENGKVNIADVAELVNLLLKH